MHIPHRGGARGGQPAGLKQGSGSVQLPVKNGLGKPIGAKHANYELMRSIRPGRRGSGAGAPPMAARWPFVPAQDGRGLASPTWLGEIKTIFYGLLGVLIIWAVMAQTFYTFLVVWSSFDILWLNREQCEKIFSFQNCNCQNK